MSDQRIDELSGAAVVVAGGRQQRPHRPSMACPFCVGGMEAPEPYDVKAFVNRWPSFPDGRSEVVLYTPEHDASFPDLVAEGARRVVDLWTDRTVALAAADVAYVLVFENRGAEVEATISHPHGQIYAYSEVPAAPSTELRRTARAIAPLCAPPDRRWRWLWPPTWRAAPAASPSPVRDAAGARRPPPRPAGARRAPARRLGRPARRRAGTARPAVRRPAPLHAVDPPTPHRRWPVARGPPPCAYRLADAIAGRPALRAAGELGSGVFVNPVVPEDAAAALRGA